MFAGPDSDDIVTYGELRWIARTNVLLALLFSMALVALLLQFSALQPPEIYALCFLIAMTALYPLSRVWNRLRHRQVSALKYFAGALGGAVVWAVVWRLLR